MSTSRAAKLPRATPVLDAAALALLAAGGLCFARAFVGLARLRDGHMPSGALFAATAQFGREERLARIGFAIAALGLVVGVVATVLTQRRHAALRRSGEPAASSE